MNKNSFTYRFEQFAGAVSRFTGSSTAFLLALSVIIVWVVTGPIFEYSNTWQLVINTGTTIITFLMVFLIQKAQNKDSLAIQIKLDELIAATDAASNHVLVVEDLTEAELRTLREYFCRLAELADDEPVTETRTPAAAEARHREKVTRQKARRSIK